MFSFVAAGRPDVRTKAIRGGRPLDSFSSLWAAFTMTVPINALYRKRIHGKEERAT